MLSCGDLRFGSLYVVINVEQIKCIGQIKGDFDQGMKRFYKGVDHTLNETRHGEGCLEQGNKKQQTEKV